jgi:hypothetical protein
MMRATEDIRKHKENIPVIMSIKRERNNIPAIQEIS